MGAVGSQITSLTIVYSTVYSGIDERKHLNFASLAFVRGIYRRPVNSPHKWPVTRKMFPFDDVIVQMLLLLLLSLQLLFLINSWFLYPQLLYMKSVISVFVLDNNQLLKLFNNLRHQADCFTTHGSEIRGIINYYQSRPRAINNTITYYWLEAQVCNFFSKNIFLMRMFQKMARSRCNDFFPNLVWFRDVVLTSFKPFKPAYAYICQWIESFGSGNVLYSVRQLLI